MLTKKLSVLFVKRVVLFIEAVLLSVEVVVLLVEVMLPSREFAMLSTQGIFVSLQPLLQTHQGCEYYSRVLLPLGCMARVPSKPSDDTKKPASNTA